MPNCTGKKYLCVIFWCGCYLAEVFHNIFLFLSLGYFLYFTLCLWIVQFLQCYFGGSVHKDDLNCDKSWKGGEHNREKNANKSQHPEVGKRKKKEKCGFLVNPYPMTTKRPVDLYRKSTVDCGPGHATFAAVHSEENYWLSTDYGLLSTTDFNPWKASVKVLKKNSKGDSHCFYYSSLILSLPLWFMAWQCSAHLCSCSVRLYYIRVCRGLSAWAQSYLQPVLIHELA